MLRVITAVAALTVILGGCGASDSPSDGKTDSFGLTAKQEAESAQIEANNKKLEAKAKARYEAAKAKVKALEKEQSGQATAVSWQSAKGLIGSQATVCGPVAGVGRSANDIFLNIGRNYPDPSRFTIVVWDVGTMDVPNGATACVSGVISRYQGTAQIEVRRTSDVKFSGGA